jgi:hypothetical protein
LEKLEETNLLSYISSKQEVIIVNVDNKGVYHYYCEQFWDYIEKRKKIARKYLDRKSNKERTWVEQEGRLKLVISSIYLVTIVGPFLEAIINFIKTRKKEWLLHPLVSFVTIYVYTVLYIKKKLIQAPTE